MRVFNSEALKKWLLLGLFAFLFSFGARAQMYGVNLQPLCWHTGSVDSTIYVAWMDAAGTTKPSRLHYFNVSGVAVTVAGGTLSAGLCSEPSSDSINANLTTLINLMGGNGDTCQVLNKSDVALITSTSTYTANTRNSIAILPLTGTVTLSVDGGTAASLKLGTTVVYNGRPCRYLDSSYTINITSGSALITWIY